MYRVQDWKGNERNNCFVCEKTRGISAIAITMVSPCQKDDGNILYHREPRVVKRREGWFTIEAVVSS